MDGKVFVFWDIDGTVSVNGAGSHHWNGEWLTDAVTREELPAMFEGIPEKFNSLNLRVNRRLLEAMEELDSHPGVTNAWLTAWEDAACTVFCPKFSFHAGAGWESFTAPAGSFSLDPVVTGWWKTEVVREFLEKNPDSRVIWVDDLIDSDDEVEAAHRVLVEESGGRLALVGVMSHVGVTPDSFAFIKRLTTEKWQSGMFLFE